MVTRDFAPRGYVRQLLKDLEMVNAWAAGHGCAAARCCRRRSSSTASSPSAADTELDTSAIRKLYD